MSSSSRKTRLFVYGSLLRGQSAHQLLVRLPGAELRGRGWMRGQMFDLRHYPGVTATRMSGGRVWGELWQLDPRPGVLHELDRYEEYDPSQPQRSLFVRRRARVHVGRTVLSAWVYLLRQIPDRARPISHGDWRAWVQSEDHP